MAGSELLRSETKRLRASQKWYTFSPETQSIEWNDF